MYLHQNALCNQWRHFYLRLILLNRNAHSDQDVLTYNPVRGGGEPLVCTSYQQSAIAHGYVDSVDDVGATFVDCVQMARELNAGAIL